MAITPYNRKINFHDWPFPHPLPPCYHIKVGQEGVGTMRMPVNLEIAAQICFVKIALLKILEHFLENPVVGVLI